MRVIERTCCPIAPPPNLRRPPRRNAVASRAGNASLMNRHNLFVDVGHYLFKLVEVKRLEKVAVKPCLRGENDTS